MITKAIDLINPEVMADVVSAKLENAIKFAPYATVDNTLVERAGDTITRPKYAYIGPAEDLEEGVPMTPAKMSMTSTTVTVKEAGRALDVTENAIITNVDGTLEYAQDQLTKAIADKVDIDYLATLDETLLTFDGTATTADNIIDAIALFGDEDEEAYILFINPVDYNELYKSMVVGNTFLSKGQLAELLGLSDIVRTQRVEAGTSYIQKQGAVEIVYKKKPEIKVAEDILKRSITLAINNFYTTNLYNEGGVVKLEAVVDTTALDAAKAANTALVEADYTVDSWAAYEDAITPALALAEVTQAEVNAKVAAINAAIALLVEDAE